MRRAWKISLVCALIVGGVYACNEIAYRNFSLRYRLTVSVEDSGQIKTGTSVIETRLESPAGVFCFPFCGRILRVYGNAVTIDLGAKGLLFVIDLPSQIYRETPLRDRQEWNTLATLPFRAYGYHVHEPQSEPAAIFDKLKHETRPANVPPLSLPMIARFRDINNPKTIEEVDPLDMAATLRSGVRFVDATLQITNEQMTPIPLDWPKWLMDGSQPEFKIKSSDGKITHSLVPQTFTRN